MLKVAGVVVLGAIMSIVDITVVAVALDTFGERFATSYANAAWTMTGYTLALATVIPLSGWAADRFGAKRAYLAALGLFVVGSGLCCLAGSIGALIAFRVVQGLGGGMLMPLGMTILTRVAGPERVGRVMAVLGVPVMIGPIVGPVLGGWLLQVASWPWLFAINLPIGVLAVGYAALALPADRPSSVERFDFVGMVLLSPGLALFLFGVSSIPEENTVAAARVLGPGIGGLALLAGFVGYSGRPRRPLLDLRLLRDRNMTIAVITLVLFATAFFGVLLLLPSYWMQVRGQDTLRAGLSQIPIVIGVLVTMPIAGALADRVGVGRLAVPGIVAVCVGLAVFARVGAGTSYLLLEGALAVIGLGLGATMMPLMAAGLRTLLSHQVARGSTLVNMTQPVSSSIGTALMSLLLTGALRDRAPAQAFGLPFTVALVVAAACLVPAALLPWARVAAP
ncbi:MAG: DHA2 family efflux MFS transporter permease subunit [Actinomycetia bacterium]|nr:DHA2 family efflux MFS transporter permease subunit [Actinomycetes bacterium]